MGKKWKRILIARRAAAAEEGSTTENVVETPAPVKVQAPAAVEETPIVAKQKPAPKAVTTREPAIAPKQDQPRKATKRVAKKSVSKGSTSKTN